MSATAVAPQVQYRNAGQNQFDSASVPGAVMSHVPATDAVPSQHPSILQSAGYTVTGHQPVSMHGVSITCAAPTPATCIAQASAQAASVEATSARTETTIEPLTFPQACDMPNTARTEAVQSHPMVVSQEKTSASDAPTLSYAHTYTVQSATMTCVTDAAQTVASLDCLVTASHQAATAQAAQVTCATTAPQHQVQYTSAPVMSYRHYQQLGVAMAYQPLYAQIQQPTGLPSAHMMVYPAGGALPAGGVLQPQLVQPEDAFQVSVAPAETSNGDATASVEAPAKEAAPTRKISKSKTGCC